MPGARGEASGASPPGMNDCDSGTFIQAPFYRAGGQNQSDWVKERWHQLIDSDPGVTIYTAHRKLNITNTSKCKFSGGRCLIHIERLTFWFIIYPFVFCRSRLYLKTTSACYPHGDVCWLFFRRDYKFGVLIIHATGKKTSNGVVMAFAEADVLLIDGEDRSKMSVNLTGRLHLPLCRESRSRFFGYHPEWNCLCSSFIRNAWRLLRGAPCPVVN